MADVKISLAAHHNGKQPGDSIEVDAAEAKRLINAGVAVPATVSDAKAVGAAPEDAASKR